MGTSKRPHPDQALVRVDKVVRFRANAVVRFLLDDGPNDMNKLWRLYQGGMFSLADMVQFYQLIGYSREGFAEIFGERAPEAVKRADALEVSRG